jgi:Transglycosylase SLT domain
MANPTEIANKECSNINPRACIRYATLIYNQPLEDAYRVANCESTTNPSATNGNNDDGLFQILYPSTWDTTPYSRHEVWSARWNSLAAMWMWAHGRRNEWQCQ